MLKKNKKSKQFDKILFYVGLSLVPIIGLTGAGIYFKKCAHNEAG